MPPDNQTNPDSDRESVLSFKGGAKPRRKSTGPKYFCNITGCAKSFKRLDQLDRHEYHHTGIKKHHCIYVGCDKVYSIVTHLKRHLRTTHERVAPPEKTVPCRIPGCLKMFQTETNMQRHIREVHENPKVYRCSFCTDEFTQKLKMRRHEIQKHTGEYPYNCTKCSKGFYQQWQHDRHVSSCKLYPCPSCDLQFEKWSQYNKHCKEKQHGRKYYKCLHCVRVYNKPSELRRHTAAKHINDELKMNFKCSDCERSYAYKRNLKQHMRVAHDGKGFDCTAAGCERVFSSAQNLAKHLEREHQTPTVDNKNSAQQCAKKSKGKRKKRKDAGQSIISNLSKFSGITVNKNFDKLLREREESALNLATEILEKEHDEITDTESDGVVNKDLMEQGLETLQTAVLTDD